MRGDPNYGEWSELCRLLHSFSPPALPHYPLIKLAFVIIASGEGMCAVFEMKWIASDE